jgi:hypothetical protein
MTFQNRDMVCVAPDNLLKPAILMFVVETNELPSYLRFQVSSGNTVLLHEETITPVHKEL